MKKIILTLFFILCLVSESCIAAEIKANEQCSEKEHFKYECSIKLHAPLKFEAGCRKLDAVNNEQKSTFTSNVSFFRVDLLKLIQIKIF